MARTELAPLVPKFVRTCRSLSQFWQFIKQKYQTYAERRTYLWDEFRALLERIEQERTGPADEAVTAAIEKFDAEHLQTAWRKALERRQTDPEGAITMARTLLETVCKHILDEMGTAYGEAPELPELYRLTSKALNLAPASTQKASSSRFLADAIQWWRAWALYETSSAMRMIELPLLFAGAAK